MDKLLKNILGCKKIKICVLTVLFTISFIFQHNVIAQKNNNEVKELNLVFSNTFFKHVNEIDAQASLVAWAEEYKKGWEKYSGKKLKANIIFTSETNSLRDIIDTKVTSIITADIIRYYEHKLEESFVPTFVGVIDSTALVKLVLMVRKDSKINSFLELKNKNIVLVAGIISDLSNIWLSTELIKSKDITLDKFCSEVKTVMRPSDAMLNLYFNKIDACLIPMGDYEIICEMNPQIKAELKILKISEGYLPAVTFLANNNDKKFESFVYEFVFNINKQTYGDQLMKIFKINSIGKFKIEYLTNIKKLLDDYGRMMEYVQN
jgi:phosphonate ABC transporter substrate-binding protein